ncbi:MAG TPA: DUF3501 domain-containing protein [Deltaproteobacteria bacterium]|nr:hypothetical protein [Deltaproteobacteria bacterium]HCP48108.1 DUF3501 domain-containing protein [Deltaproteobacteria bacterium]
MRPVERSEILDYVTYEEQRSVLRASAVAAKAVRRIHVGQFLCFLFENRETVRYQVQEMMRAEQIVREADILHELATYNELLGSPGQLGCTLLIGIDDIAEREVRLVRWRDLNPHLYLVLEDGSRVRATWDERQVGTERLSAVQYLFFDTHGAVPVAIGCDHSDTELQHEVTLLQEQREALTLDLSS